METLTDSIPVSRSFAQQSLPLSPWLRHFRTNRLNRQEPDWDAPCALPDDLRKRLGVSLSHFQLGETGTGRFLFKEAAPRCDAEDFESLQLFIAEEGEHARLLARLVERFGGRLVTRHWTHRLFKVARQAGGFHFEIQMLLTGEIVGTAYYELLDGAVKDGPLNATLGLMLRDEASHVAFHLDRMKLRWREWLPLERAAWELQFQVLVLAAVRAAWLDHGGCLRAVGLKREAFEQRARRTTIRFLDGLRSAGCSVRAKAAAAV